MALVFISPDDPPDLWQAELTRRMPELEVRIWPETGDPAGVEVALVWQPPPGALQRFPNLKAMLSLGAGIDGLLADPTLPDLPLARMVDPSLTRGMSEYVLAAVLRHHRRLDRFALAQARGEWAFEFPKEASERRVGIMGLGTLGSDAARVLKGHGFDVAGWSRSGRGVADVRCYGGLEGLGPFLAQSEILICLLPLTVDTRDILNANLFEQLPQGACVINVARGAVLVDEDLLDALDRAHLGGATLDVFREEPLPADHPFWRHPQILVTPHVASYCQPASAADNVVANIRRALRGEPLAHQVDRARGY